MSSSIADNLGSSSSFWATNGADDWGGSSSDSSSSLEALLETFTEFLEGESKILKLIFQLILVVHLLACFFYLISFLSSTDPIVGPDMKVLPQTHPHYVNATMLQNRANACYSDSEYETYGSMVNTWVCEAGLGPGNADAGRKYVTAAYWAITTMSTIGCTSFLFSSFSQFSIF